LMTQGFTVHCPSLWMALANGPSLARLATAAGSELSAHLSDQLHLSTSHPKAPTASTISPLVNRPCCIIYRCKYCSRNHVARAMLVYESRVGMWQMRRLRQTNHVEASGVSRVCVADATYGDKFPVRFQPQTFSLLSNLSNL